MRSFKWISAINSKNNDKLNLLERQMIDFYSKSQSYYDSIDFTQSVWNNPLMLPQMDIIKECEIAQSILEVGCGRSNLLMCIKGIEHKYSGAEFSKTLLEENRLKFPAAEFYITNGKDLEVNDRRFDLVFSHFVLEHAVYPHLLLLESLRVLNKGGVFIILCSDFTRYKNKYIPSQILGLTKGNGMKKLKDGKYIDAIVTFFDSRIRMPIYLKKMRKKLKSSPQFMINSRPLCLNINDFEPDLDAVYVTNQDEIRLYLSEKVEWVEVNKELVNFCEANKLIYLKGIKK